MRNARLRLFWYRAGPLTVMAALAVIGAGSEGCSGGGGTSASSAGGSESTGSSSGGPDASTSCTSGTFQGTLTPAANGGFTSAFDATPDSEGETIYFTGVDPNGNAGVFKKTICPTAGAVAAVYTGGVFEAPFSIAISSDDTTLFVADLSAAASATDITQDNGVLFSLPAAGGTAPTILVGSVSPRSVAVVQQGKSDVVYFTGIDKTNLLPGVFSVPAAGGAVTTVGEGPPFDDPGGIVVTANGDVYVLDTSGSPSRFATIIKVASGSTSPVPFVTNLQVGYPAGFAGLMDDSQFLISGMTFPGAESDALIRLDVSTMTPTYDTTGIATYSEAAGLHRARNADVFAWADTKATPAGMTGTGTVFVVK